MALTMFEQQRLSATCFPLVLAQLWGRAGRQLSFKRCFLGHWYLVRFDFGGIIDVQTVQESCSNVFVVLPEKTIWKISCDLQKS
jgi:hypothetical protein